tara:strand:- start:296 stop:748 length:453 start_codon:yes stop_codon:yes gene_type:complete
MAQFTAADYMVTNLITLRENMNVYFAIGLLLKNNISGAPVVDEDNNLIGILSEKDCLRIFADISYQNMPVSKTIMLGRGTVEQFMTISVSTVESNTDLFKVAETFLQNNFRRIPVLKKNKLVGQISRRDVLKAIKDLTNYNLDSDDIVNF